MLLSKLTPAESLLLRKGDQTPLKDVLKYTLMDLLLKQVLVIQNVERQPSSRDPIMTYKYVATGKNFNQYISLPHELVYISAFRKNGNMTMLFRNCVQVGFENARSEKAMQNTIMQSPALHDAFSRSFFERLFGGFSYSDTGFELRITLDKEIEQLEQKLPDLMITNREEALEQLRKIGGNVFLLQGLNLTLLKEIEEAFLKEVPRQQMAGGVGCSGCSTFTSYNDNFESSCPSENSSSDGGGCSGDSGCGGGCGGCGGD
jgi:hypothetical protein